MIVAREPDEANAQLAMREKLVTSFPLPEGISFYTLNKQHVFKVATTMGYVGFLAYLRKGNTTYAFDPATVQACTEALRKFQALGN